MNKAHPGTRRDARARTTALLAMLVMGHLTLTAPLLAQDNGSQQARHERELKRLRGEIAALEKRLTAGALQKSAAETELRETELQLAGLARQIADLRAQQQRREREMTRLGAEREALDEALGVHRERLTRQVIAAHRVGRMQLIQLVLNQQDPALVSRGLAYARYLNAARVNAIRETDAAVKRLGELLREIAAAREALAETSRALANERTRLGQALADRAALVADIDRQLDSGGRRLGKLRDDSARLEELLRSLQALLNDIPAAPLENRPFRKSRGGLPWPAKGTIAQRYNTPRGAGDLKWRGILIAAPAGNNVRAVYHGQVVFADWLPGLGLLAIIDHGDDFMSLYGYNQTLLKETGDWVTPGEIIATVGNSGGQSSSGVYFEIRKDGKPINPQRWLSRRYSAAAPG